MENNHAQNLGDIRRYASEKQAVLAENMGATEPQVSKLESGDYDLRLTSLVRYVEALGAELTVSITFPDHPTPSTLTLELPRYCYEMHCPGLAHEHLFGSTACGWNLVNGELDPKPSP